MHPSKPGTAPLCPSLDPRSATFISSSAPRVNHGLAFRPSSSMADGTCHWGFDLHHYFRGGSECLVWWKHGALPPGPWHLELQYGFRGMRLVGWITGESQTTSWNKSTFSRPPSPPQIWKLQVKPITAMVQKNMHAQRAGWGDVSSRVVGIPSLTLLPGFTPSSFLLPAVLGLVSSPFPMGVVLVSTLAGGGQRLVDWGLEAAHVLHCGTVCFHWLHVLVQDSKNLVVQDLILPDPVGHLLQGLEAWWGRKTGWGASYVIWPDRKYQYLCPAAGNLC